jgi:hypothetical protein
MGTIALCLFVFFFVSSSSSSSIAAVSATQPHKGLADLPPLLEFANGTAVTTVEELKERKNELKELLSQYYYGSFPHTLPQLINAELIKNDTRENRSHYDLYYRVTFAVNADNR